VHVRVRVRVGVSDSAATSHKTESYSIIRAAMHIMRNTLMIFAETLGTKFEVLWQKKY